MSVVWLKGLIKLLIIAVRLTAPLVSRCPVAALRKMQQPTAAQALWPPELQEKARCFSYSSEKPCDFGQLGRMWFLPLFSSKHKPFELGREVTQPALLPGCCSRPPQDSDSQFRVVFLAAVGAKLEQHDHSHIASHASAMIVLGFFFCNKYSVGLMCDKIDILMIFFFSS